jgi:diaminohydroxyphosphoribosylaminopyrimidine deaminase / 5-amino-6-(5-phosphoribosylamino)uracil reductase
VTPETVAGLMAEAVVLAERHRPHPNPRVGAIVVDVAGQIVGRGAHERPGTPHAEVHALSQAGSAAVGGTMVVTLEPCNHHGRTPPCTEAMIAAGVSTVWVGAFDPDRRVSGAGVDRLRAAGISVEVAPNGPAIEKLDPGYFHHRRTGRSRVVHKAALTLDGQIAAGDGTSQWLTGPDARSDAHLLRASVDAVMVGTGTLFADDPRLDVRLPGYDGPQPRPVVIAGSRPLPARAAVYSRDPLVIATAPIQVPGELVVVAGQGGRVDLAAALTATAEAGLLDVLVEGGAGISASLWEAGLVDAGVWYLAARIAGGIGRGVFDRPFGSIDEARRIEMTAISPLGPDIRLDWRLI